MRTLARRVLEGTLILIFYLAVTVLPAQAYQWCNFTLDGYLLNETAFAPNNQYHTGDGMTFYSHKSNFQKIRNVLNLELSYQFTKDIKGFVQVRPVYDAAFSLGGDRGIEGRRNMDNNWSDEAWYDYEPLIREGWLELQAGRFYARIGKQLVTWGTADGFRLMDAVNTFNYRDFIKPADEDYKIPNAMLNLKYRVAEKTDLQFLIIPRFIHSYLPEIRHPYAFNVSYAFANFERALGPAGLRFRYDDPSTSWGDASYGVRLSSSIPKINLDYTLNWLRSYDQFPILVPEMDHGLIDLGGGTWFPRDWKYMHNRQNIWGGTFSYNIPGIGPKQFLQGSILRGEFAYIRKAAFTNIHYAVEEQDTVNFLVGFDKYFPWRIGPNNRDWWVSAQFKCTHIVSQGDFEYLGAGLDLLDRWQTGYSLLIMTDWLANRLSLYWLTVGFDDGGLWTFPKLTWEFTDKLRGTVGYYYIKGHRTDLIGEFRDNDTIEMAWKYSF